ncbi:hypothetical protein [Streptomyces dubilierae]|uniref:Integral membrane protein n=1 Tax=Streptomyces dubilierae TaxID=3075533 RepID=A0ABU2P1K9_9ACTN|nr:hypothetical protein [Streptomyces sp. DSM 41921]MDT0385990.1 hypothetical protein [Streptomyces sp. DSM 41921]
MLIIAWSGLGWLTFPILVIGTVIGALAVPDPNWGPLIGGSTACLVLWFWGRKLNRYGRDHTMWAVPMHWWGASLLAFGWATVLLAVLYAA